jgi:hypothetical protein
MGLVKLRRDALVLRNHSIRAIASRADRLLIAAYPGGPCNAIRLFMQRPERRR